jgi:DNA gyrase subunit A
MQVAPAGGDEETTALLVVSDGGFGKRTALKEYRRQGRAGYGVLTAKMPEGRGELVGALIVRDADEIFAITSTGVVIRMSVQPLRYLSRPTGGVKLVALAGGATVVAVAHNGEAAAEQGLAEADGDMLQAEAAPDGAAAEVLEADATAPDGPTDPLPGPDATPEDEEGPA